MQWFAGRIFCKVFKFLQTFALASSNYLLVGLAVDRHQAIIRPLAALGSANRWENLETCSESLRLNAGWWQLLGWAPWYPHYLASSYLMFWSNLEKMELQEKNVSVTLRFGLTPPRRATSVESSWWYLSFHSARCSSSTLTCSSNWEKALRQTRWLSRWS